MSILNDYTRYQEEPGNADPEALPPFSQARREAEPRLHRFPGRAWEPVIENDLGLLYVNYIVFELGAGLSRLLMGGKIDR